MTFNAGGERMELAHSGVNEDAQDELAGMLLADGIDPDGHRCRSCGAIYDDGQCCAYCGDRDPLDEGDEE